MTKTIFGKRLLLIATITVLVSGLTIAASFDDAEAKKAKTGEHKLKCKSSIGSWFNPEFTGLVFSSSEGKCSAGLGKVTSAAITAVDPVPTPEGCLLLSTAPLQNVAGTEDNVDFSMGKKGFIEYTTTATQCLFDENGLQIDLNVAAPNWCQIGGAHTSTVHGEYIISDGMVKDTIVVGGSGDFVSKANHCDDKASYGNSFKTDLKGTIVFQ
jgi:hypothetical protein